MYMTEAEASLSSSESGESSRDSLEIGTVALELSRKRNLRDILLYPTVFFAPYAALFSWTIGSGIEEAPLICGLAIFPGGFLLAAAGEKLECYLDSRSSLGRKIRALEELQPGAMELGSKLAREEKAQKAKEKADAKLAKAQAKELRYRARRGEDPRDFLSKEFSKAKRQVEERKVH